MSSDETESGRLFISRPFNIQKEKEQMECDEYFSARLATLHGQ